MSPTERRYVWDWWFDAPPARVWPLVSDTNRLDRLAGLPPATYARSDAPDKEGVLDVRQTYYGLLGMTYEEEPFDWVEPEHFTVKRHFAKGPVRTLVLSTRLEPESRGTKVVSEFSVTARSRLTELLVPAMMRGARRGLDRAYKALQREVSGEAPAPQARRALVRHVHERLHREGDTISPALVDALAEHLATADASALARVRPFALAHAWKAPRREALDACLHAVRAGVLELSWESLCPHCRKSSRTTRGLSDVRAASRCDACGLDFEVEFDRSLEAVFKPAADLRGVAAPTYCLGGPGNTPHVVAQTRIAAGAQATLSLDLEPGAYRVRAVHRTGVARLRVEDDPSLPASVSASVAEEGVRVDGAVLKAGAVRVVAANRGARPAVVVVESLRWLDDVATALDVVSVPGFRDLFTKEVLAPGERIAVRRIAILFTDLKGSTNLYHRLGDAAAYALVRDHFRVLREVVGRRHGMFVKTLGDAVMAAFRTPAQAVAAAIDMHRGLAGLTPPQGGEPLVLKTGVHQGPSLVVNAGGMLDFFGTTSNLASRAQEASEGGDVVVTEEILADEDVTRLLASVPHADSPFRASLKGFEGELVLHRLSLRPQRAAPIP